MFLSLGRVPERKFSVQLSYTLLLLSGKNELLLELLIFKGFLFSLPQTEALGWGSTEASHRCKTTASLLDGRHTSGGSSDHDTGDQREVRSLSVRLFLHLFPREG